MTRLLTFFLILLGFCGHAQTFPPRPDPPRLVNDLAGILSPAEQQSLESKLVIYNDSTSTQIAIVTMHSIGDNDINEYGTDLFNKWGIGQKGKDNGILILVALDDHKAFIVTGRGAEARVPDMYARRVVDNYIVPNFRQNKYYDGLNQATDQLFRYLTGEYKADKKKNTPFPIPFNFILFLGIFLFFVVISVINRIRGGGSGYTSSGPYVGGGFFGGGFGGGGSDFGGGGGFGGFGGGSSGGGGAGGSW